MFIPIHIKDYECSVYLLVIMLLYTYFSLFCKSKNLLIRVRRRHCTLFNSHSFRCFGKNMTEENVMYGPPTTAAPVTSSTGTFIYRCLLENVHRGILFRNAVTDQNITYKEFLQFTCSLADSLDDYGITAENFAGIYCENCVEYFIPVVACLYRGIPVVPINPSYTENEFTHAFNLTKPDIIFCTVNTMRKMLEMKSKFPKIKAVIVINSGKRFGGVWNLMDFTRRRPRYIDVYNYEPLEIKDLENHIAFIMFSSGTTGLPKGVMTTHKNVNVKNEIFLELANVKRGFRSQHVLGFLPFFHIFGLQEVVTAIMRGQTVVILEKFDFELYLKCIDKYRITELTCAPPIMQMFAKSPLVDRYNLSHVEEILVGAAPVSKSIEEDVKKRTGIKRIGQGYGMTETTFAVTLIPVNVEKHGSCGKLLPHTSAIVKDLETGKNLGPNRDGELCFKGGIIMKGYYKNDAANTEIFTQDGYMRSGDIGRYDEEGYFYIVDRLKELIKYKGHQVAPAELEAVLMTHPKIKDAGVVGLPDIDAGEVPAAFVVKQPGVSLTEEEVVNFVKNSLAPTKYLRGGVIFVEDIPKSPSGKILRRNLRAMLNPSKSKL